MLVTHTARRLAMQFQISVHIDATPAAVWAGLIDVERWPDWTPSMNSVRRLEPGPLALGSSALVEQPALPPAVWKVNAITPGESFTWRSRVRGVSNIATHSIRPDGRGGTLLTLELQQRGIVATVAAPLLRPFVARAVRMEANGLKQYVEARQPQPLAA
jgi:hypothetical protein